MIVMGIETMIADADRSAHWEENCAWKRWMPSGQVSSDSDEPMISDAVKYSPHAARKSNRNTIAIVSAEMIANVGRGGAPK